MSSYGYPSRFGPYGGGFDGPYAGGNLSAYRRGGDDSFGGPGSASYAGAMYAGAYDPALGAYGPGGPPDMNRGSFAPGRYHPYG
jgi:heterogeneous nuclear ribonucleoprotein A1/A3